MTKKLTKKQRSLKKLQRFIARQPIPEGPFGELVKTARGERHEFYDKTPIPPIKYTATAKVCGE